MRLSNFKKRLPLFFAITLVTAFNYTSTISVGATQVPVFSKQEVPETLASGNQKGVVEVDANFEELNFFNANGEIIGQNATKGFTHRYLNVITVGTHIVDAIVTVDDVQHILTYDNSDGTITNELAFLDAYTDIYGSNPDSPSWIILRQRNQLENGNLPFSRYKIEFVLSNSMTPVALKNFTIATYDIDSRQYVQMSGATSVTVQQGTSLNVVQSEQHTIRAFERNNTSSTNSNTAYWAQFNFNKAHTVYIEQGQFRSQGAVWFYDFDEAEWDSNPVTTLSTPQPAAFWNGNGVYPTGDFMPISEICGIANGAPVDGPYLLWILTATKATNATIAIGSSINQAMSPRRNGSFRYVQTFSSGIFTAPTFVYATHDGTKGNLVISHGCTQSLE